MLIIIITKIIIIIKKLLNRRRVLVISIVLGALETVPKGLEKRLEELEIRERIETKETTELLRSARRQRKFLSN